jgi:hypothetical protein
MRGKHKDFSTRCRLGKWLTEALRHVELLLPSMAMSKGILEKPLKVPRGRGRPLMEGVKAELDAEREWATRDDCPSPSPSASEPCWPT